MPELTALFQDFYADGKKRIPDNVQLNPMMLAVWFMDDGSKCREQDVYINTQQFSHSDQMKCIQMLAQLKIEGSLNKDKEYTRIRIKKTSIPVLYRLIADHVIPSMKYKLSYNPVTTGFSLQSEMKMAY